MKFVTFNIRCDFGQDGANNFIYRRPLILEKIRQEKPDIIGFQEVLPHVAAWLKENLTEYYIAGCGREKDLTGEAMIIAYRKERFQSVSLETFWLSPTPYVPGSRYPVQSMCPRTATDVVFEDMETGKVFRVINTHLDHECAGARKLGLEQILAHLRAEKAFADVPVILSGDFNAEPDSEEMKPLRETAGLVNATEGIGITFHNYHRDDPNDPQCSIDYIILKGDWELKKVEKWTEQKDGVYYAKGLTAKKSDATTFIPNAQGHIVVKGLEDDAYSLTEIATDKGYVLLKDAVKIVIKTAENGQCEKCEAKLLTASATVNGKDASMTDGNAIVPLTVVNNPGFDLPKTGGYGTWMFTIGGVALLGAAAFIVVKSRKHKSEQ